MWWAVPEPWSPATGSSASGSLEEEFRLSVGVRALSGEGMQVLARCAEAAVDSPHFSYNRSA